MKSYLRVRCNKAYLANIRDFVRSRLDELDVHGKTSDQIVLAVDEACANCMIHQHQCDNYSTIEVAIFRENGTLYAEIKDSGKAFPIHTYRPKNLEEIVKLRAKGGLGINLIHRIMDEIKIEETPDYSIYIFGKKLPNSASGIDQT
ncbi:MAG: ATP-binding protein [Bacteroidia bacterium]|nr:ATP-binding protein [Bacteroidia bacterium]